VKISLLFPVLLILSSCSQISYIVSQGVGQLKLQNRARDNQEVLKDKRVPQENKHQIKLVEKSKTYFYRYFGLPEKAIYSKTSFLDEEAVTYLVTSSPYHIIKATGECFPIVGCFPYLGFFSKENALKYKKRKEEEGYVSSIRPVYAYSTLGYFSDPIISSFFHFSDKELVRLVFHELFHTVLFVRDQVDINEALANFFAEKLSEKFWKWDENEKAYRLKEKQKKRVLEDQIVELTQKLQARYKKANMPEKMSPQKAQEELNRFLSQVFEPKLKAFCSQNGFSREDCYPLDMEWNNAKFSEYLVYEERRGEIEALWNKLGLDLKAFYRYLKMKEESFEGDNFIAHIKK